MKGVTEGGPLGDAPLGCTIEVTRLAEGFRPLEVARVTHDRLDGAGTLGPMTREVLRCGTVAVIIPYDPRSDRLVLIRQFRIGNALRTPHAGALELPAGLIDPGESVLDGARRELREETGLEAEALAPAFDMMPSPGLCDEYAHIVIALVDASRLAAAAGLADEHEDIRPLPVPVDEALDAIDAGRAVNGFLVAGLFWFARRGRERAAALAGQNGRNRP
ncbi:NUDIX hydrolase [Aurantimonas sp. Leaf443]|uniref:NUDIX domain-containing protein n=1 Tax=Aurantimonas sp. Leaf443 TaxID=1736378 RepID=UPI0006FD2EA4|nr:NUDIX hydrolase [Aurantimonas sp. Leaf443]KQT85352.1 hypothetical protein ASG48_08900 [Aurantimonas sp. Leaf443]